MKKIKKLLSLFLALVIMISVTPISTLSQETGVVRYTELEPIAEKAQDALVTGETFKCEYEAPSETTMEQLEEDLASIIYTYRDDDAKFGQYLLKSGDTKINVSYHNVLDYYDITISENHSLTEAEERYVEEFAKIFKQEYIPSGASDFEKVKIIYDFIVRNCEYDQELFDLKNSNDEDENEKVKKSDRFRIAHSAFGAIRGNQLRYDENYQIINDSLNIGYNERKALGTEQEFVKNQVAIDFNELYHSKMVFNTERIVALPTDSKGNAYSNGRAVCEGYSKLFYYLCVDNGVKARIVDGDYVEYTSTDKEEIKGVFGSNNSSGRSSNPHEWNYVLLDDEKTNGKKWYMVDATWGSQLSLKNIDYNDYEFFLIGTEFAPDGITKDASYSTQEHQQPYFQSFEGLPQLYDWYSIDNACSNIAYGVEPVDLSTLKFTDTDNVIIRRTTDYDDGEGNKVSYIFQGKNNAVRISIDEDKKIIDSLDGFEYNGRTNAEYVLIIPYLTKYQYKSNALTNIKNAGTYSVTSTGKDNKTFSVDFKILPIDMSDENAYSEGTQITTQASYNGNPIIPSVKIIDGHSNKLTENDYDIVITQNGNPATLKEMGTYNISIKFKGNYTGSFPFVFTIGRIDISQISLNEYRLPYLPNYYRNEAKINTASDFFNGVSNLGVGTQQLVAGVDYTVSSTGSIDNYNDKGTLTISSAENSNKCLPNKQMVGKYIVSQKFDISSSTNKTNGASLDGQPADSNKVNVITYDGTAKKPTTFDYLDERLVRGKDYEIVGYANNINAGKADLKIRGIGGCTGEATLHFMINRANITTSKVTASMSGSTIKVKVVWNGKTLVEGTDYKFKSEKLSSTVYLLTIDGINNFAGTMKIQTQVEDPAKNYVKPTSSGNKLKLSKSTYVYDGKYKKPTVTLVNKNGKTVNSYYYDVSYKNNKDVGIATATIKFKNGYAGTMSTTFTINPKPISISSLTALSKGFTVKWKKQTTQTDGYEIRYSTSSSMKNAKSVSVTKNSTVSKKITKLTAKKKYYVQIRTYKTVNKTNYYSTWSAKKSVKTKK